MKIRDVEVGALLQVKYATGVTVRSVYDHPQFQPWRRLTKGEVLLVTRIKNSCIYGLWNGEEVMFGQSQCRRWDKIS